jgi:sugar lactone lactonase YvrE
VRRHAAGSDIQIRIWKRKRIWVFGLVVIALGGPAAATAREPLDVELFARVPDPGSPEGIAVDGSGGVFVGTSPKEGGPLGAKRPSKVFAYDAAGTLTGEYVIEGQDLDESFYGLLGMAFDGRDLLYAVDAAPPRIVRLDPRTGEQAVYARFHDVRPCGRGGLPGDCSATVVDMPAFPDYPVFGPDGTMYVTDLNQALIWRVPPGGGDAEVWFTDNGFETLFGPNGIQFMADGRTLLVALTTQSSPTSSPQRPAGLYRLPVRQDGGPGDVELFWRSRMDDAPDGFAIALSGNVYAVLSGPTANAVALISPGGEEVARVPTNALANQQLEVPFDQPASAAFLGERVLVTNHAVFTKNPASFAVLDVFAGEPGLPLFRPRLEPPGSRLRARVRPKHATAGERTCFRFRVRLDPRQAVSGARVRFLHRGDRTGGRGRARICAAPKRPGRRVARIRKPGFAATKAAVRIRAPGG